MVAAAGVPAPVAAQVATVADPDFHGEVTLVTRGRGSLDPGGEADLKIPRWRIRLTQDSNGIYPDLEPIIIALWDQDFPLPAGALERSRNGKVFAYRARGPLPPGSVRSLRVKLERDGSYLVRFQLAGVNLDRLLLVDRVCAGLAVIIGDDDGFSGVSIRRRSFTSRRLSVPTVCTLGAEWPHAD
jgi:hypothetical protein